jgi:hypothetical protein
MFLTASDCIEKDDCFCFSKRQPTVAEIAELVAEGIDDTGLDPDNSDREDDDSGSDGDDGNSRQEGKVRVYMDLHIERGEADTDRDSSKKTFEIAGYVRGRVWRTKVHTVIYLCFFSDDFDEPGCVVRRLASRLLPSRLPQGKGRSPPSTARGNASRPMRRMKLKVVVVTLRGSGGDRTLVYWGKTFLLSRSLLFLLKTRFQKNLSTIF